MQIRARSLADGLVDSKQLSNGGIKNIPAIRDPPIRSGVVIDKQVAFLSLVSPKRVPAD